MPNLPADTRISIPSPTKTYEETCDQCNGEYERLEEHGDRVRVVWTCPHCKEGKRRFYE